MKHHGRIPELKKTLKTRAPRSPAGDVQRADIAAAVVDVVAHAFIVNAPG